MELVLMNDKEEFGWVNEVEVAARDQSFEDSGSDGRKPSSDEAALGIQG
jgi:hypothetical protein